MLSNFFVQAEHKKKYNSEKKSKKNLKALIIKHEHGRQYIYTYIFSETTQIFSRPLFSTFLSSLALSGAQKCCCFLCYIFSLNRLCNNKNNQSRRRDGHAAQEEE